MSRKAYKFIFWFVYQQLAFLLLAAVMVAVASAQYLATYPRAVVASPYAYRAAYAPAVGYAGVGAYGYPAGRVVYG